MRLISCHIENFGKLSNFTIDFSEGVNIFCEENGWGKSTFANFILVMLYGFGNDSKRDDYENDRKRYKPWQGGTYGGELTYEKNDKLYTINRVFGSKAGEDSLEIRELPLNIPVRCTFSQPGEEIFGIDRNSFCRTVFISQNDCETIATDGINAKLGNITDNTDDINNYEAIASRLKDYINNMTPKRKTGELYKIKSYITVLDNDLRQCESIDNSLDRLDMLISEKKKQAENFKAEQEDLKAKRAVFSAYTDIKALREKHQMLSADVKRRESELSETAAVFSDKIPSNEEISAVTESTRQLNSLSESMKVYEFSDTEETAYKELCVLFADGVPDTALFDTCKENAERLNSYRHELESAELDGEELIRFGELSKKFENRIPEETDFLKIRSELNENEERKRNLVVKNSKYETLKTLPLPVAESGSIFVLIIASIVLMVAGVILFSVNIALGISGIVIGAILFISALIIKRSRDRKLTKQKKELEEQLVLLLEEIEGDKGQIENTDKRISEFFGIYGIEFSLYDVNERLYELKNEAAYYKRLLLKVNDESISARKANIQKLTDDLNAFFVRYGEPVSNRPENQEGSIYNVKRKSEQYLNLSGKKEEHKKIQTEYALCKEKVDSFFSSFGFTQKPDILNQLMEIRSSLQSYEERHREYSEARKHLEAFESENDMDKLLSMEMPENVLSQQEIDERLNAIDTELEDVNNTIRIYRQQAEEYAEKRDELTEKESERKRLAEEYEEKKKKLRLIELTKDYLEKAKLSFTAKYMEPIMKGYRKYYCILSGKSADDYFIDANTNLTIKAQGKQRETKFLSTGFKDLTGICMRMALVDAMYEDEKPFIVFDDPFVNLDEEKTVRGKEFLKELSKEYQVIYFTCHGTRSDRI